MANEEFVTDWLSEALDRLFVGPDEAAVRKAQARLRQALEPVCYYDAIPETRVGAVYVAVSGRGLVAVDFGPPEAEFVAWLKRRFKGRVARSSEATAVACRQIAQYLAGTRKTFELPIDWSGMTDFQRRVLEAAAAIQRGQIATYGELAGSIGRPGASRAVGRALGSNPMPIVIPCHRVLAADGSLRGYGAGEGVRTKAALLRLEGVPISDVGFQISD